MYEQEATTLRQTENVQQQNGKQANLDLTQQAQQIEAAAVAKAKQRKVEQAAASKNAVPQYEYYTVKADDTLRAIAEQYGLPIHEIRAMNDLNRETILHAGMQLRIRVR